MFAPTCFRTARKFCRSVLRETSAQVGRVATRLRISAVLATFAIIAAAACAPHVTLGLVPIQDVAPVSRRLSRAPLALVPVDEHSSPAVFWLVHPRAGATSGG